MMIIPNYLIFGRDYEVPVPGDLIANGSSSMFSVFDNTFFEGGNILSNDTLDGNPVNSSNVELTILSVLPSYVTIDEDGNIIIDITTLPTTPEFDIDYQICENGTGNCVTATSTLAIYSGEIKNVQAVPPYVCDGGGSFNITGEGLLTITSVKIGGVEVDSFIIIDFFNIIAYVQPGLTPGMLSLTNSVFTYTDIVMITTAAPPTVAEITSPGGVDFICVPNTLTLSNITPTGAWGSTDVNVATVNASGVVTAISEGYVEIRYTVVSGVNGCSTTKTFGLFINQPVTTENLTPTRYVLTGSDTTFKIEASGTTLIYQWEVCTDQTGVNFTEITDDATYIGSETDTLEISNVDNSMDTYFYQCRVINDCNEAVSDLSVLLVGITGITSEPDKNNYICDGGNIDFTVVAEGEILGYQWQEDQGGDNWLDITDGGIYSGVTTDTLSLTGLTVVNAGWRYKCVITNSIGTVESNPAVIFIEEC